MRDSGEFKFVTRRKKRISHARNISRTSSFSTTNDIDDDSFVNYETLSGKLLKAEVEVRNSSFADNVFHYLKDSLTSLNSSDISDILCYGLGHFSKNRSSKYQLALLLSLKKHYNSQIYIYDPVFSPKEIKFLKRLDFNVITINEEGKHIIRNSITLVYMPHCSVHLINNFLYANWCRNLNKCILLTNSFSIVMDNLKKNRPGLIDYIIRIQPYVTEIILKNDFTYEEVFNDLSIHTFFERDIDKIPENFWNIRENPCYQNVTSKMKPNTKLLHSLVQEIRRLSSEQKSKNNIMIEYILEQARSHRETSEVLCKAREELNNLAETYLCYLNSQRVCKEIQIRYTGKGERSVKETADLVGFKLPHDPK